ncbi:MAG: 16S rRNA (guanine(527)-N(7))-methyltransferase RsmG [Bacteroidales bacterium]|jgi:16S rRNA (guanine527-N7)-methyltransferase
MENSVFKYFPSLSDAQKEKISRLEPVYSRWNDRINVISRKDMDNFFSHHVLHSLSIAKIISFREGTRILDIGTGGGFPGIPLSILFPDSEFILLDSIEKKIKVVRAVTGELDLANVKPVRKRAEDENGKYDFIVSRAVSEFRHFVGLASGNISKGGKNSLANGIISLKGGDLGRELYPFRDKVKTWDIREFFNDPYFETKKIVYLPV